ncbi:MAG: hypothetical protein AAFX93_18635 [Verrucomicrobiota bacterium]
MPKGRETIDERIDRLEAELDRVRVTIANHENNGQSFNISGTAITQVAYEKALDRQGKLERLIDALYSRKEGSHKPSAPGQTVTRMHGADE